MKKLLFIYLCVALMIAGISDGKAQTPPARHSLDADIMMLRNTAVPGFNYHYDDYTPFAPGIVMLGLKTCGYDGRSEWGRMLVSDAFSAASMAVIVTGMKHTVKRLRPDESASNSFPSRHTATAFMTATMLHKEYEGRSPWFSIGGYALATLTGVSRVLNNRHWLTDVAAGAAIGIGSVHLGYFITDKIFKDRQLNPAYEEPEFYYDPSVKHYTVELLFGRRFVLGAEGRKNMGILPQRGSLAGLQVEVPVIPGLGVCARATASGMIYNGGICSDLYTLGAGGYWNYHFARILEFQTHLMAGCAWLQKESGVDLAAGIGLSLITDSNFKVKVFADFESLSFSSTRPWTNTVIAGWSSAWFW